MLEGFDSTDFLEHVDAPLAPEQRDAILAQIRAELPKNRYAQLHPRMQARSTYQPQFSTAMEIEYTRLAKRETQPADAGVDLKRYEALEAPGRTSPQSDEEKPELLQAWRETLQKAYTSSTYLSGRNMNLSLLETYGKNAWLIGNNELEAILRDLERELVESKRELEMTEEDRRMKQESIKAEMTTLEETWKKGVRGIVEVEIATGDLKNEALTRRRAAASH